MARTTTRQLTFLARLLAVLLLLALPAGVASARTDANTDSAPAPKAPKGSNTGRKAVSIAKRYLGVKYKWGGSNPKTGFDCSGLTMYVYRKLGVKLLHYTGDQWREGYRIPRSQLRRGDLVFFDMSKGGDPQHEGIYVGNGKFIHAPHTGDVVKISSLASGHYAQDYIGAVRPYGYGPPFLFPVVGGAQYTNDYGESQNRGIDVLAPRKALIAAPESGRVKLWHNRIAGCGLTLYGKSLITYVFTHLNNDTTKGNDNLGHCNGGIAYAPKLKNHRNVKGGQVLGFVGDSGSADGTEPHVNVEVHPKRGDAVNPYKYLNRAKRLVFAALPGRFSLRLMGSLVSVDPTDPSEVAVKLRVDRLRANPGNFLVTNVARTMTTTVTADTALKKEISPGNSVTVSLSELVRQHAGRPLTIWTAPQKRTLDAQLGLVDLPAATLVIKLNSSG
jgi:murein DD-endopeptidase MepM/ murein hydrolase activator NlpD